MRLAIQTNHHVSVVLSTRRTAPLEGAACGTMRGVAQYQSARYSVSCSASAPEQPSTVRWMRWARYVACMVEKGACHRWAKV